MEIDRSRRPTIHHSPGQQCYGQHPPAEELHRTRTRIAQLSAGDGLFVSEDVAIFLYQLQGLGISQHTVNMERDVWILLQSASPENAASWIADKLDLVSDPEFRALYLDYDAAFAWSPRDPRLNKLAERTQRWADNRPIQSSSEGPIPDPVITMLIASATLSSPAWDRLTEIVKQQRPHT